MNETGSDTPAEPGVPAGEDEPRLIPFVFEGKAGEFFRIWIVNIVLTVLTLGIYSAWAKVRTNRYFFGSTKLDGRPFEYTANPVAILKGRLIAMGAFLVWYLASTFMPLISLLLIPPMLIALPWVIVRSLRFRSYHTRYRSLRFHFYGGYGEAAKAYLWFPFLTIFTVGLLWPYVVYRRSRFVVDNLGFGNRRCSFFGNSSGFYAIWGGLFLYLLLALALSIFAGYFYAGRLEGMRLEGPMDYVDIAVIYLAIGLAFYVFPPAYLKARQGNYVANNSQVAGFLPHSDMQVLELFWIYATNILAIIFTLGLAVPWAMIRSTRYRLEHTRLEVRGDMDKIVAGADDGGTAIGDELGEAFDIEVGF